MGNRTINQLPDAGALTNDDIFPVVQNFVDSKATLDEISQFVLQDSDYAVVTETRTADHDYLSSDLIPDYRIFANSTSGNITLGFFNGSDRDGTLIIVKCIGTANQVNIELATDGVTDYVLIPGDVIIFMWDDTNSIWQVLSQQSGSTYDYIVNNQEDFNFIIERVAANQYKIADGIRSIYVKNFSGGYQMTGGSSPLSGGDTWGYIETNNCTRIIFEPEAYIDMHQERGYLEINTDYCYLNGVSIRGDKGIASAIQRSFLLNANYVTFFNCDSQSRLSNTTITIFEGSGTTKHNETSTLIKCRVENIDSSGDIYGFRYFHNVNNCVVFDIQSTAGNIECFANLERVINIIAKQIDATGEITGLINSRECSNITLIDFNSSTNSIRGLDQCYNCSNIYLTEFIGNACIGIIASQIISNINIYFLNAVSGVCYGISGSDIISNCNIDRLDATSNCFGLNSCNIIANCNISDIDSSTGNSAGCLTCTEITGCNVTDIDSVSGTYYGINNCTDVTSCEVTDCENGFRECTEVSSCTSSNNDTHGFSGCTDLTACTAYSNGTHGFNNSIRISTSNSYSNTTDGYNNCITVIGCRGNTNGSNGFDSCNHIGHNRANTNTGAQYTNSFADWAATQGTADTAAGGWNA